MEYNLITNVESCYIQLPQLLYYSHWPSILISLFFGLFVFFKSGRSLLGKILLSISISFSLWAILNLIVWITVDSMVYSFFWSFFETLSILFYFLVLYFGYVFIEEKDVSFKVKLFFLALFLPVAIISSTKYYLVGFNATTCDAIMNDKFLYYIYFLKGLTFIGVLFLLLSKYIKYQKDETKKAKIIIGGTGLILLLSSFLITQYFGDFVSADLYTVEFYGLFAIDIFIGFLAYLIVKYDAFNIKLLATQALMVVIVILIASQFAFIQNPINKILNGITLTLASVAGYMLIRSVKKDNERKEELQYMANRLAQANDQLRRLDNAKTEFISIASHQLRTPLTAIKGFVSLILEGTYGEISEPIRGVVNKIYISGERLIGLVENLLSISRMESGRMEYQMSPMHIEDILKELYDSFKIIAQAKDLSLDIKLPEDPLPEITADHDKIREVISNFIDNALKYTKRGCVVIGAKIAYSEFGDKVVRITISDTGIGIPRNEIGNLFVKFSRGGDTTRLNASGTGLGLYVAKNIVEAHKGRVWAESDGEDMGSRFIMELLV